MAIRFTDIGAIRAQLAASLGGASSALLGTSVAPPSRTGVIASQSSDARASIAGVFTPAQSFSASLVDTLDSCASSIRVTVTAPIGQALTFPRVMLIGVAGDQGFGSGSGTGFTSWTTAANGTAANTAVQIMGSYDAVVISGVHEGWDGNGTRDRENLTQALLKAGNYTVSKNATRKTLTFYYEIMNSTIAGNPYAQWQTLVNSGNWLLYPQPHGGGTATAYINYSAAWPGAIGSASIGSSICGTNYGSVSLGSPTGPQGPARAFGNYAAIKLLMRGYTGDPRFSFNVQMGSPSAAGIFLDQCFVALDGDTATGSASLDGLTIAPGTQQGGGFPGLDTVQPCLARGIHNMFDQLQTMLAQFGSPGKIYYNFGNIGQYANRYQFGTQTLSCGLEGTMHGGLLEDVIGADGQSWEFYQIGDPSTGTTTFPSGWPNLRANYYQGMDFCIPPKLVGLGTKLPSADGSQTASWAIGAGRTPAIVTAGSAFEYQLMRYGLCTTLLDDGYFAPGCSGYDWSKLRWYDEYGDDSLTQVNVKRGYLGMPLTTRPTAPTWAQGPMGVWSRSFTNGIAIVNPRGNGAQTVALQNSYQALNGTQQPTINNGQIVSSVTIPDGDGRIYITPSFASNFATLSGGTMTTIFDRQFNKTDSRLGNLPPVGLSGTDQYGMAWNPISAPGFASGVAPIIDTTSNLSALIGSTIPPLPDGNATAMAIKYPTGYPAGFVPFDIETAPSGGICKRMYAAMWVLMPSNFNCNGNNIKWVNFQNTAPVSNHIWMLNSFSNLTDGRAAWMVLQGGGGSGSYGGQATNAPGAITSLHAPPGTGPGWWPSNMGTWHCLEWFCQTESNPGVTSDGVFIAAFDGVIINKWTNIKFNAASGDSKGFNFFGFIPYWGGGGGAAGSNQYLVVGRMFAAQGN